MNHLEHLRPADYNYLAFRRSIIFADEWLSYLLLVWIHYVWCENNWLILWIIIILTIVFNFTGYYYLHRLELSFRLYEPMAAPPRPLAVAASVSYSKGPRTSLHTSGDIEYTPSTG